MKNPEQTYCDACLNEVAGVLSLTTYDGALVCDQCITDLNEMIEDYLEEDDYIDHDIYHDQFEREYEEPNPYHGTYSEE